MLHVASPLPPGVASRTYPGSAVGKGSRFAWMLVVATRYILESAVGAIRLQLNPESTGGEKSKVKFTVTVVPRLPALSVAVTATLAAPCTMPGTSTEKAPFDASPFTGGPPGGVST